MPYSISQESCFISPVCIARAESAEIAVFSLKLGVRLAQLSEAGEVSVLLVSHDKLLFEAAFRIGQSQQPLLSFLAPAHILQTGVITAYVVLCGGEDGRISDIVDSGRVLVFPRDAAAEVTSLFDKITRDVQQFFNNSNTQQAEQQQQQHPPTQSPLLRRAWQSVAALLKPSFPQQQQQQQQHTPLPNSAPGPAAPPAAQAPCMQYSSNTAWPDAATLYAYEHFLIPFFRHWAAVLHGSQPSALQAGSASSSAAAGGSTAISTLAVRLLHFLLDNEMWACSVLLLGKFPEVAEQVLQVGLELPGDFCDSIILERLRAALPLHSHPVLQGQQQQQQQQQFDAARNPVWQQPSSLQQLRTRFNPFSSIPWEEGLSLLDSTGSQPFNQDDSSFESATEILKRLGVLQHQKTEQEALGGYLQVPHVAARALHTAHDGSSRSSSSSSHSIAGESSAGVAVLAPATEAAAPAALAALLPNAPSPTAVAADTPTSPAGSALNSSSSSSSSDVGTLRPGCSDEHDQQQQQQQQSSSVLPGLEAEVDAAGAQQEAVDDRVTGSCGSVGAEVAPHEHAVFEGDEVNEEELQHHLFVPMLPCQRQQQQQQARAQAHQQGLGQLRQWESSVVTGCEGEGAASVQPRDMLGRHATAAAAAAAATGSSDAAEAQALHFGNCAAASTQQYSSCPASDAGCKDVSSGDSTVAAASLHGGQQLVQPALPEHRSAQVSQDLVLLRQLLGLARVSLSGFPDTFLEQSYLVFKNHSLGPLDATASLICSGMLLASTWRSFAPQDYQAWAKMGVLLLYGVLFFFPYMLMQSRRQLYLQHREQLLVVARSLSSALLCLVALGLVPQPDAWVTAVTKTLSLQLQNAFILPSCQQLRLPAAFAIAVVHVPSDMLMLGLRLPLPQALVQSCLIGMSSLLVALVMDARCRWKFVLRYPGATRLQAGGAHFGSSNSSGGSSGSSRASRASSSTAGAGESGSQLLHEKQA